jgi:hypothetical protein
MNQNVGLLDRILRLLAGIGLIAWASGYVPAMSEVPSWGWLGVLVGAVLAVTALSGVCPAYALFGFNTCRRDT